MDSIADNSSRSLPGPEAFTEEALSARLAAVRKLDLPRALPRLMLELDRMLRVQIGAEVRVDLLRCIKQPILKAVAGLPKPKPANGSPRARTRGNGAASPPGTSPPGDGKADSSGITLEQRLLLMMTRNLRHALYEIDRTQASVLLDDDVDRIWVLEQTFRFMGRQLRFGIDRDRPWPKHSWQDLHDLFVYLVARGSVRVDAGFTVAMFEDDFDMEVEYKRLLLLGLLDRLTERRVPSADYYHLLKRWATESRLDEPEQAVNDERVVKVEVTRDEPPRLREGHLGAPFRGWVLRPPRSFYEHATRINQGQGDIMPFSTPNHTSSELY